jgi:hypothetical protein
MTNKYSTKCTFTCNSINLVFRITIIAIIVTIIIIIKTIIDIIIIYTIINIIIIIIIIITNIMNIIIIVINIRIIIVIDMMIITLGSSFPINIIWLCFNLFNNDGLFNIINFKCFFSVNGLFQIKF